MKPFYVLGKLWAALLLCLAIGHTALATELTPVAAAGLSAQATAFLQKFVSKEGKVDYAAIQRRPELLNALMSGIADFEVKKADPADQYAFYLNAYNILVIGEIVRNYPLASVQSLPGFFNRTRMQVGGEQLTLDQIETDKLRKIYDDPRLHFALACGTTGCPRLNRTAYVGKNLSAQLNNQARFVLLDPDYVQVDDATKMVRLPEIFQWYEGDFGGSSKTGVMYVNQFRKEHRVPTWYAVEYCPYNWTLNDQKPADGETVASK